MGKKGDTKRKRSQLEEDDSALYEDNDIELDRELQAELNAVLSARQEKITDKVVNVSEVGKKYNREGLLRAVEELKSERLPFIETYCVDEQIGHDSKIEIEDENDDLTREMTFYNHTMAAVKIGRTELEKLNIPIRRPDDFFCENLKSDMHMAKIKDRLLLEQKKMEAFELRKNRENNRKFNKQVADLRKQEKSSNKKSNIQHGAEEYRNVSNEDMKGSRSSSPNPSSRKSSPMKSSPMKSNKRINMDKKYSFGGKDRMKSKLSDKKSLNDLSEFNPRGGKYVRRERPGKGKPNSKPNRPGKEARQKRRKVGGSKG